MTPGIYSLVSAIDARWVQQERIADNMSGASGTGHKRRTGGFESFGQVLHDSQGSNTNKNLVAPLSHAQPSIIDFSSGPLKSTEQPLDVAINGKGFFVVQTPVGERLTRDGHFNLNASSQLVNHAGFPVLGSKGPITISEKNGRISFGADGALLVNGNPTDKLKFVVPTQPQNLQPEGESYFVLGGSPVDPNPIAQISSGFLESSNVELPRELVEMLSNQRMEELLTRAFQMQDEGIGRAIQDLTTL